MEKRRMDSIEALKLAMEREKGANKFYREAAETTRDPSGKKTFKWLAKEEGRHLAKLGQQFRSVVGDHKWLEWKRRATPIEKSELPPVSEAVGEMKVGAAEKDALRQAIESEKQSKAFYKQAAESTPDLHGKAMFNALAKEEEGHLALLEEELEWITRSRQYFTLHRFRLPGE